MKQQFYLQKHKINLCTTNYFVVLSKSKRNNNHFKKKIMLAESIVERAFELVMYRNREFDIAMAIEEAISEEQKIISELMEQKTERSISLKNAMRKKVYAKIALADAESEISKF